MDYAGIVTTIRRLALEAGAAILEVYGSDDFAVRAKSDASPVTEADERADALIARGLARRLPRRSRSSPRSRPRATALIGAGLLPRRPARRHQGVRPAPRRLHRQHRADRERRPDPRRRLRPGPGPALLHRRRRPVAGGGGPVRRRRRARSTPLSVGRARPRGARRRRLQVAPRPGDRRLHRPLPRRRLPLRRLVAEVLPRRRRRGRPLPAPRPHDGVGHRRRPGGAARRRRAGGALRRPRAARLRQAGLREPLLHRLRPGHRAPGRLTPMAVLIVIPARYASTRYPGKPLVELAGRHRRGAQPDPAQLGGGHRRCPGVDRVVVATDDDRIADAARGFGAEVAMTPETCRNGTERCARGARATSAAPDDVVVNLQGDAPLTPPWFVVGARRGDAGRPDAAGGDAGAALRRRGAGGLPRGPPPRPGRRHHRGLRPRRAGRSTSPRRSSPTPGGRSAPARRSRSSTTSASTPTARRRSTAYPGLADGPARDLGGARAAALHGERRCPSTASRSRPAAAPSGSSTTRATCRGSRRSCRQLGLP